MNDEEDDVLIISYGTNDMTPGMENLRKSLQLWNYSYSIIGIGEKWDNYITKTKAFLKEIKFQDPERIICIIDCYDVLACGPRGELCRKYLRAGKPIVVGAMARLENNGAELERWWRKKDLENRSKPIETSLKYLNSGCIIGRVKYIRIMLEYIINFYNRTHITDDQIALCHFVEESPEFFELDINSSLFGNITTTDSSEFNVLPKKLLEGTSRIMDMRKLRRPCLIHIPSKESDLMMRMNIFGKKLLQDMYTPIGMMTIVKKKFSNLMKPSNRMSLITLVITIVGIVILCCYSSKYGAVILDLVLSFISSYAMGVFF